jgi:hypothetical protein
MFFAKGLGSIGDATQKAAQLQRTVPNLISSPGSKVDRRVHYLKFLPQTQILNKMIIDFSKVEFIDMKTQWMHKGREGNEHLTSLVVSDLSTLIIQREQQLNWVVASRLTSFLAVTFSRISGIDFTPRGEFVPKEILFAASKSINSKNRSFASRYVTHDSSNSMY